MDGKFWDEKFANDDFLYGEEPNEYFKQCLNLLSPGYILVPACGEGRDAIYAAQNSWKVVGVDYSKRGLEKARQKAIDLKVIWDIEYIHADLADYDPPKESFDAAVLSFAHFPPDIRSSIHQKIIDSLKPGGKIILEAFSKDQLKYDSGGPGSEELLYSEEELKSDFKSMTSGHLRKRTVNLKEGPGHQGKASVIRYFGSK